jgi:PAS domain S-box-containing protein
VDKRGRSERRKFDVLRKIETYTDELSAALNRADALRARINSSPEQNHLLSEAAEELSTTIEELLIADEELRQQNEQLVASREELEAQSIKYEDLFESAPDGYLVTDPNGLIIKANRSAAEMLRLESRFLLGKPLISYIVPRDHKSFRYVLNKLAKGDSCETEDLELHVLPRNGQIFTAALRFSPTRNRGGLITELRWTMRDITQLKRRAERILELNSELEARVSQRTAELEQVSAFKDELLSREQRARADAEAANRSKDEFLAIVSHELRTPLNAILGWAQLLGQDVDREQRLHAAEVIERSARAQARLINDILDVSRVVSGGLSLDKRPVDLAKVIEAAVEAARPGIESKGIKLIADIDYSAGVIVGDSTRLQQIVGNILSNSTKFTPQEGTIDIRLEKAGEDFRITVTDSGFGINREFLPYVFDRFRQADSQVTRQQGGLGLGLAIVKFLVELHGGTVGAASEGIGKGSTFTVTLPGSLRVVTTYETAQAESQYFDTTALSTRLAAMWVVVIDDDHDAREMMRAVLESSGARVTTCGSYEEALALFNERATAALTSRLPDVLVADIAMPGFDGFDLIRAIRRLEPGRGREIPAIALTAYADEETRKRALEQGYQKHLTKPLVLEDLVTSIAEVAERGIHTPPSPSSVGA